MADWDSLNDEQRAAALHDDGPAAVHAGPGSGKTRMVALRAARLAGRGHRLLVTTFTNDATIEMRERIERLIPAGRGAVNVSTLHALCLQVLRTSGERFGLLTDETVRRGLAEAARAAELEGGVGGFLSRISREKNLGVTSATFRHDGSTDEIELARAWRSYEKLKVERGLREFDDLTLDALRLLETNEEARTRIASGYTHILVDECQDMNAPQFHVVFALARDHRSVMLVGDPDQSLYAFRGADPITFRRFAAHPKTRVFELRSNYRSSKSILQFADALIKQDASRRPIELSPTRPDGDPVVWERYADPDMEALAIGAQALELHRRGAKFREIAVLYRVNAQSEAFERHFAALEIPYAIKDEGDFYSRKEIRGLLAYLRLFNGVDSGREDSSSMADEWLLNVINVPNRKLGGAVGSQLRNWAELRGRRIWDILPEFQGGDLKSHQAIRRLNQELRQIESKLQCIPNAGEAVRIVRAVTDFDGWLRRSEQNDKDNDRIQNLQRMQSAAGHYRTIAEYLQAVDRIRDEAARRKTERARRRRERDEVTFATGHGAKGLEWRFVFAAGWSEELLPHRKSEDVDEERRIAYVIATRAKDRLNVSTLDTWNDATVAPSRFLTGLNVAGGKKQPMADPIAASEPESEAVGGLFFQP